MLKMICLAVLTGGISAAPESTGTHASVESAARIYRIRTYEMFRLNRQEYDQRRQLGDHLLEAWHSSGGTGEQAEEVIRWFATATYADSLHMFPAMPHLPAGEKAVVEHKTTPAPSKASTFTSLDLPSALSTTTSVGFDATTSEGVNTTASEPGVVEEAEPSKESPAAGQEPASELTTKSLQPQPQDGPSILKSLGRALLRSTAAMYEAN